MRGLELQDVAQEGGRRQHVEKQAVERHAGGQRQQQKARVRQQRAVALHQVAHLKRLAVAHVQRFGQQTDVDGPQHHAHAHQKPEYGVPTQVLGQHAAHDGRQRRRHAEKDGDLAHHLLRFRGREHVAHHRAGYHHARAARQALQRAKEDQLPHALRQRATERSQREQRQAPQDDGPAAKAVGQRTMKQVHEGIAEQIRRQRLLHLHRRRAERLSDGPERRNVGIDGERPEHAEHGQQDRQGPARTCPQAFGVGVHSGIS